MNDEKTVYLNPKQAAILKATQKARVFIGGRGSGKSTVIGDYIIDCMGAMPGSSGGLWAPTDEIITSSLLPEVQSRLQVYGYEEGYDYVIGKKPPEDFLQPLRKPVKYDKVISFADGCCIHMISLYSERAARGLSLQWGAGDEMGFIQRSRFTQNVRPAMRGSRKATAVLELPGPGPVPYGEVKRIGARWVWCYFFEECPWYLSFLNVSSMPYLDLGKWLLSYEQNPQAFYIESTAYDNIEVLGQQYIDNLREELSDIEFRIEVMNERVKQLADGFYPSFNEENNVSLDNHYSPEEPIELSWDFGNFSCISIYQNKGSLVAGIDCMYEKRGTVQELTDRFIEKYKGHKRKIIEIWGDRNGNNSLPNSKKTLYQEITSRLQAAGWKVRSYVRGLDPPHADKHLMLNEALKGENENLPKIVFHAIKCKPLIISIQGAPMREDFKKDKRSEHPNSKTPQEYATHFSDTFDNYYFPKYRRQWRAAGARAFF